MDWTTTKPEKPGAYWVRGYSIGRRSEKALVEVRTVRGEVCCNIHTTNTDHDDDLTPVSVLNARMEWCGPLTPPNACYTAEMSHNMADESGKP